MDYVAVSPTEVFTGKAFYKNEAGEYTECVVKRPGIINGRRPITIPGKEGMPTRTFFAAVDSIFIEKTTSKSKNVAKTETEDKPKKKAGRSKKGTS